MKSDLGAATIETGDPLGQWANAPAEWLQKKLWDLAIFINGRAFKPTDFASDGLRVIKITELKYGVSDDTALYNGPYEEKHLLQDGDILFAWSGNPETSLDAFRWSDGLALLNQHIFRVIPHDGLEKTYLFFLLKFVRPTFIRTARDKATSMGHVKISDLKRLIAWIPPRVEQRAIASILAALDDKIELNRRMNETLEALAQSLFKSWFVPAHRSLGAGGDATQSALPKAWREGSILEVGKLLSGGTPKTEREDYWNGDILWASAKDVSQCGQTFLVTTERTITKKGLEESATQLIPAFCTVVVARGATTGRMTMFGRDIAMNQTCYALASTTGTPFALYCLFRHEIDALVQTAHGSVFDTITTSTFAASKVVLPPQQVFDAFEKTVSPIFARILSNIEESRTLAALRDALLPKLLSGELRVPAAAPLVEAHA